MKKTLAALLIATLALPLAAAPYRALNPDSLISGNPKKPPISVNLGGVETAIRNLSAATRRVLTTKTTAAAPSPI